MLGLYYGFMLYGDHNYGLDPFQDSTKYWHHIDYVIAYKSIVLCLCYSGIKF